MRLLTGSDNDNERSYAAALVPSGSTLYGAAMVTANGTIFKNHWLDCGLEPPSACNQ